MLRTLNDCGKSWRTVMDEDFVRHINRNLRRREVKSIMQGSVEHYARARASLWLGRVLDMHVTLDSDFFACLFWVCGGTAPVLRHLSRLQERLPDGEAEALQEFSARAKCSPRVSANLAEELLGEHPVLQRFFVDAVQELCAAAAARMKRDPLRQARRKLHELFGLDAASCRLSEFIFLKDSFPPVERYFEDDLHLNHYSRRHALAFMLQLRPAELKTALHSLQDCGCLESDPDRFSLNDDIAELWRNNGLPDGQEFFRILKGEALDLADFPHDPQMLEHVRRLLAHPGKEPVHLLFYGEPGTGKSALANSLAASLDVKAFSVVSRRQDDDDDRRCSLAACIHMASRSPGAFVLVDEAERMLETNLVFGRQTKDKAWLNDFLEKPGQRVIWITNHIEHIDQAVRRRFTFSIHFSRLGTQERGRVWDRILQRHDVAARLSESERESLVRDYDVPAGVINNAAAQGRALCRGRKNFFATLRRVLDAYVQVRNNGTARPVPHTGEENYTLDGVCTENSLDKLLERYRRLDAHMRNTSGQKELPPGCGAMLFYGPPGTGKSALAHHIARMLNRECLVRRASDLLNMYVGESEKNIARTFAEAERSGALLLIDEADSFIFSRDTALHNWEHTLVNEFLTSLERFRGLCVCTTNRRESMDAAAMRRFSFKVAFTYAGSAQCQALYESILAPLAGSALPADLKQELSDMSRLTPGDFHAVRSRHWLDLPGETQHRELLDELRLEQTAKLDRKERKIGFRS